MDDLILVRGTATGTSPADRGVLRITARVKQPTSAAAERALAELTSDLDAVLNQFRSVISARSTAHLSIRPNSYWHPEFGRTVVDGHVGERSDARQRAEQYAEGLGLTVGGVANVCEPDLRRELPSATSGFTMSADTGSAAGPTVDLGTAEIQISASVDVGFRIEPGP